MHILTEAEAVAQAEAKQRKYRRDVAIVSFTDDAGRTRFKVYFVSEQGKAMRDCRVGETPRLVGRVLNRFGYLGADFSATRPN